VPRLEPFLAAGTLCRSEQPALDAGTVRLRPWRDDDVPTVIAAFTDPQIAFWHHRRIDDATEAREWIAQQHQGWRDESTACWAVCDAEADVVMGRVAVHVNLVDGVGVLGYWTLPGSRGRGSAPASVRIVTAWAFEDVGLARLELGHSTRNTGSCRVAEKVGYLAEGTLRSMFHHADGRHDVHLHAAVNGRPQAGHGGPGLSGTLAP